MGRTSNNKEVPMEKKGWLIKDFPVELRKQVKIRALEEGVLVKEIVIKALTEYLKKGR
jgi:hypothetical protein